MAYYFPVFRDLDKAVAAWIIAEFDENVIAAFSFRHAVLDAFRFWILAVKIFSHNGDCSITLGVNHGKSSRLRCPVPVMRRKWIPRPNACRGVKRIH